MVKGLEIFRKHFAEFENQYVLIGGTACDLLFQEQGLSFRATKDLDMVLVTEALTPEFGMAFWSFIRDGLYEIRQRSNGTPILYRFQRPKAEQYPEMIELFSRQEHVLQDKNLRISCTRIPIGDEISSLSAILLNDAYYQLLQDGVDRIDGVSVLSVPYLILFKAKAWLDLSRRREEGERVDSKDIKKHRYDVLRLATLLVPSKEITITEEIFDDMKQFLNASVTDPIQVEAIGIRGISETELLERIRKAYRIS